MDLSLGASARIELTVTEADTAIALGSGDVDVLGTPRVIALAEQATVAAIATQLAEGSTSVGTRIDLAHIAPTVVGGSVVAEATLAGVEGRLLTFDVIVRADELIVARGHIYRAVVDRDRFLQRAHDAGGVDAHRSEPT